MKPAGHRSIAPPQLAKLPTRALLLDENRMLANIDRLRTRMSGLRVGLRPHLKTPKSGEVARRKLTDGNGLATVSTWREAEVFFGAGARDILYAVGIAPQKLPRVVALRPAGCDLTVILDTPGPAEAVAVASRTSGNAIPALIEIDGNGHRGGLAPGDVSLIEIGTQLPAGGAVLRGALTNAGESYAASGTEAKAAFADQERSVRVGAATRLQVSGLPTPESAAQHRLDTDRSCHPRPEWRHGGSSRGLRLLRPRHGLNRRLHDRRHRPVGSHDRRRASVLTRLEFGRCRLDGHAPRPGHAKSGRRSGLWHGVRRERTCATRPHTHVCHSRTRHHRGAARQRGEAS